MSDSPAGHVSWPDSFDDAPLSSSLERRKYARKKLAASLAVVLDPGSHLPATVVDLSEGGVGVHSDLPLQQGAICRLQLSVPNSNQVIDAACELAWNRAPHAGFRFTILSERSQRQIKEWLMASAGSNGDGVPHQSESDVAGRVNTAEAPAEAHSAVPKLGELSTVSDEALLGLAIEARGIAQADGAAVAVDDGDGMICRASLGSAPDVGVRLQSDRGLSGECLRTGEIVVCYDSETDSRVDRSVSQSLKMRSAVILPIGRHETPAGLLEVFFAKPQAFSEASIDALHSLASAFVLPNSWPLAPPKPEPVEEVRGLPQMASFTQREAAPGFVICDVCGRENEDSNRVCDYCDVPLPSALRYIDLNAPEEGEAAGMRERQLIDRPHQGGSSHRKKLLFMLLVALVAGAWQARGRISADTHRPTPSPHGIHFETEDKAPDLRDQPPELPSRQAVPHHLATKKAEPSEPEVTVRTFAMPAKQPHPQPQEKTGVAKPSPKKIAVTASTIPREATVAQQLAPIQSEQTPSTDHPIMLPLNDDAALSAVSAPPAPPARAKEPGLWKRIGKKLIWSKGKPAPETEKK